MLEERKEVPQKNVERNPKPSSLFDPPAKPESRMEAYEYTKLYLKKFLSLERKLDQVLVHLRKKEVKSSHSTILSNADFVQLFKISGKTAQNWRDEGLVKYYQVKGKIYYKLEDVEHLLMQSRK